MTPTEQDKELRDDIISILRYSELDIVDDADAIMQLITADRKRVGLEARIDELEHWKNSVHENTGNRGGSAIKAFNTAVRYFRENIDIRIVELKQELEKL